MKASVLIFVCFFIFSTKAVPVEVGGPLEKPFEGFQVLSTKPKNVDQVQTLSSLRDLPGIDFWSFRPNVFDTNVFSVSPDALDFVKLALRSAEMEFDVFIEDLQSSVEREREELDAARQINGKGATFDRYMRYDEIYEYARELAKTSQSPLLVTVESAGRTVENRDLWVVKVQMTDGLKNGTSKPKPAVFVDSGIHAREWISPAVALYLLHQLVENATTSKELLSGLDWYIMPVLNPDGYEFTHNNSANRMWRKNRKQGSSCAGVDLNRNYGFHWNENGASQNPCSEVYSGVEAFSEPEAKAMSEYILRHKTEIKTYLTFHSFGYYILYPWGYTTKLPEDWKELDDIAREANKAMVEAGSKPYKIGSSTNVLYAAAGGSDDWAKGGAGIAKSYTIELPGNSFIYPPSDILKTVTQVFEGIRVFAKRTQGL